MSVVAVSLPILGPIIFRQRRESVAKAAKSNEPSSYSHMNTPKRSKGPAMGSYSRALSSIDKLITQGNGKSMASITPIAHQNERVGEGIHVKQGFEVRVEHAAV